jgi:hypothetical protein
MTIHWHQQQQQSHIISTKVNSFNLHISLKEFLDQQHIPDCLHTVLFCLELIKIWISGSSLQYQASDWLLQTIHVILTNDRPAFCRLVCKFVWRRHALMNWWIGTSHMKIKLRLLRSVQMYKIYCCKYCFVNSYQFLRLQSEDTSVIKWLWLKQTVLCLLKFYRKKNISLKLGAIFLLISPLFCISFVSKMHRSKASKHFICTHRVKKQKQVILMFGV